MGSFYKTEPKPNLKMAFLGQKFLSTFISGNNITDGLSRVFLNLLFYLATAVERKISILLRGLPKEQVQSATKISNCRSQLNTAGQCQIYWEADPQTSAPKQWYSSTGLTTLKSLKQLPDIVWIFVQISHFQVIFDGQWWNQISTHFSDSRHQECIILARIGDGPCNCY